MEFLPFALVLASSVSHALWNYLAKGARDKESFMLWINVFAVLIFIPIFLVILPDWSLPVSVVPFLLVSGVAEALYFLGLGVAYEEGDLSVVYPLARSSPMFVAVAAFLVLGEKITRYGFLGIFLIFVGVYTLHLKGLSRNELLEPLRGLRERSSMYALLAAFGTTVYSISDKLGVTAVDPLLYSLWLGLVNMVTTSALILARKGAATVRDELHGSGARLMVSGFLMKGGYMLVLVAMSLAEVSYILALRQSSVVLGAFLGVLVLKEKYGRIRLLSSIVIFLGVYVLGALA